MLHKHSWDWRQLCLQKKKSHYAKSQSLKFSFTKCYIKWKKNTIKIHEGEMGLGDKHSHIKSIHNIFKSNLKCLHRRSLYAVTDCWYTWVGMLKNMKQNVWMKNREKKDGECEKNSRVPWSHPSNIRWRLKLMWLSHSPLKCPWKKKLSDWRFDVDTKYR